jgi:hypothetical protein
VVLAPAPQIKVSLTKIDAKEDAPSRTHTTRS